MYGAGLAPDSMRESSVWRPVPARLQGSLRIASAMAGSIWLQGRSGRIATMQSAPLELLRSCVVPQAASESGAASEKSEKTKEDFERLADTASPPF